VKYFCWHNWTKWGAVIKDYNAIRYQYRGCKKCNKIIRRKAFWNNSITDDQIMNSIKGLL